jgi:hypothetical protein
MPEDTTLSGERIPAGDVRCLLQMWTSSVSHLSRRARVSPVINVSTARHAPPRRLLQGRRPSRWFAAKWDGDVEALTQRLEEFTK